MKVLILRLMTLLLFSIPLEGILITNNGISLARILGAIVVLLWLINFMVSRREKLELSFIIKMNFVFIVLILLSAIFHSEVNIFNSRIFTIIRTFFFLIVLYNSINSMSRLNSLLRAFSFGVIFLCGIGIYEFMTYGEMGGVFIGTGQNTFALHLVLAIPMLVYLRNNTTSAIRNLYTIVLVVIIFGLIISESRSAFLAVLIYTIYYSFIAYNKSNKNLIFTIVPIAFLFVILFFFGNKIGQFFATSRISLVKENVNSFVLSDIQYDGRIVHWWGGILIFIDNPITGVGFGKFQDQFYQEYQHRIETKLQWDGTMKSYGPDRATHSSLIGFMSEFGIIGFIYWCYFGIIYYKKLFNNWLVYSNNRNLHIMYKMLFIILFCFIIVMELETSKIFWIVFVLIDQFTSIQLRQNEN